nr:TPA_asm: RNA-dependent RNA polymerase P1 [Prunus humilis associated luteovirus]
MFFDSLLVASVKVVKDFVSYLYTNLKFVYKSLKRWLLELQGKFIQHDAFVDMVYGFMDDVEEWEWEAQIEYEKAHIQMQMAKEKLLQMQKASSAPLPVWPQPMRPDFADPIGPPTLTDGVVLPDPPVRGVVTAADAEALNVQCYEESELMQQELIVAHSKLDVIETEEHIKDRYAQEKGAHFLGKFINTLSSRLAYVKRCAARRAESVRLAAKVQKQVLQVDNVPDFEAMCTMEEIETGETKQVKGGKDGDEPSIVPIKRWVRRLRLDDPQVKRDACKYIRRHVIHHNCRLNSDEVSLLTINRYVSQFAELMKLDQNSSEYLLKAALLMVPIVDKQSLLSTMVVQSPAARELRAMKDTVESGVF